MLECSLHPVKYGFVGSARHKFLRYNVLPFFSFGFEINIYIYFFLKLSEKNVEPFSQNLETRLEGLEVNDKTKASCRKLKNDACLKTIQVSSQIKESFFFFYRFDKINYSLSC